MKILRITRTTVKDNKYLENSRLYDVNTHNFLEYCLNSADKNILIIIIYIWGLYYLKYLINKTLIRSQLCARQVMNAENLSVLEKLERRQRCVCGGYKHTKKPSSI